MRKVLKRASLNGLSSLSACSAVCLAVWSIPYWEQLASTAVKNDRFVVAVVDRLIICFRYSRSRRENWSDCRISSWKRQMDKRVSMAWQPYCELVILLLVISSWHLPLHSSLALKGRFIFLHMRLLSTTNLLLICWVMRSNLVKWQARLVNRTHSRQETEIRKKSKM